MIRRYAACWCWDDLHLALRGRLRLLRSRARRDARSPWRPHLVVRLPGGQVEREDVL